MKAIPQQRIRIAHWTYEPFLQTKRTICDLNESVNVRLLAFQLLQQSAVCCDTILQVSHVLGSQVLQWKILFRLCSNCHA